MTRVYRCWVIIRGESKWKPLGEHGDISAAWTAAHKRFGRRLVSVRSVPTPADPTVERKTWRDVQ